MADFNFKLVSRIMGFLLFIEAMFMLLSAGVAAIYMEYDLRAFLLSVLITALSGGVLAYFGRSCSHDIQRREGIFIVATAWVVFSFFGLLPFYLSGGIPSITDAFFETMSGFTTTGASILNDIESLPHGLLFWRSLIQWLGGMGIIVFTLALLPLISTSGGVHLFNFEAPGLTHDKLRPRISQTAKRLWGMYLTLTVAELLFLWIGPMTLFDAVCHSFTTMATGGYSTKQASIAFWDSAYVEYVVCLFMFLAGVNFTNLFFVSVGNFKRVWKDEELKWYLWTVIGATLIVFVALISFQVVDEGVEKNFRLALFQVISILTTTGYATGDYVAWGVFFSAFFLILMIPGGSAGSTAGGMKIIRVVVMIKNSVNEFFRNIHPKAIVPVRVNNHVISFELVFKVLAFLFLYVAIILISVLVLTLFGTGLDESIGAVVTSISNVGPGLGSIGPAGNFYHLHPFVKWYLALVMVIGRLELFTVLTLFTASFWKK